MSRIARAFASGKAFIPFITGGDPDLATTEMLVDALVGAGADVIEIGVPFSDPIAEGPVIEAADQRALGAGCTTVRLLETVARIRERVDVPLILMTYYNPVFFRGVDRFVAEAAAAGVDGLIVPDLPFEERDELHWPCATAGLDLISMIAPTSKARIGHIARHSTGFLYCVSSLGVTGERDDLGNAARSMIARVRETSDIPCAVGFGVSTPDQAREVVTYADGVIVGSAIVRIIAEHGRDAAGPVHRYAASIKEAIRKETS